MSVPTTMNITMVLIEAGPAQRAATAAIATNLSVAFTFLYEFS